MAGSYNPETYAIELPCGDTATISLDVTGSGYEAAVFAIYNPEQGKDLLRIPVPIEDGKAVVRIANRHTRDIKPGDYKWQLRFVTDPVTDTEGNIIADEDSDDVISYFGSDDNPLPDFILRRDGAYV